MFGKILGTILINIVCGVLAYLFVLTIYKLLGWDYSFNLLGLLAMVSVITSYEIGKVVMYEKILSFVDGKE